MLFKAPHHRSANVTRVRSQGLHGSLPLAPALCSPGWGRLAGGGASALPSVRALRIAPPHLFWNIDSRGGPEATVGGFPVKIRSPRAIRSGRPPYLERFLVILSLALSGSFSSYDGWKPNSGAIPSRMLAASSSTKTDENAAISDTYSPIHECFARCKRRIDSTKRSYYRAHGSPSRIAYNAGSMPAFVIFEVSTVYRLKV